MPFLLLMHHTRYLTHHSFSITSYLPTSPPWHHWHWEPKLDKWGFFTDLPCSTNESASKFLPFNFLMMMMMMMTNKTNNSRRYNIIYNISSRTFNSPYHTLTRSFLVSLLTLCTLFIMIISWMSFPTESCLVF